MWEPKTCCICFDAKSGSLIFATLKLITSFIVLFGFAIGFIPAVYHNKELETLPSCLEDVNSSTCIEQRARADLIVTITQMSIHGIQVIVTIMFIHGTRKDKHIWMIPFLAYVCGSVFTELGTMILSLSLAAAYDVNKMWDSIYIYTCMSVVVNSLLFFVIRSHYKQIKRQRDEDNPATYSKIVECEIYA